MRLGKKYKAFLRCLNPKMEFLEGTTSAGKTTVGIYKFILKCWESPVSQHIIAGLDAGTIEKNIINKEHGIIDEWGELVEYRGGGTSNEKMSHILLKASTGVKKIYILGYDDRKRWKKALGAQYGCLFIDEINIADMDFVREAVMRCEYVMATLNPDAPELPVYKEYINHSRPLKEWEDDTPVEILRELSEERKDGWVHWFFSFDDNVGLTAEKKKTIIANVPAGTKIYKNKILGLRGKATGLVFPLYKPDIHGISKENALQYLRDKYDPAQEEYFEIFTSGLDTSYSANSADTIAMTYGAITNKGRAFLLAEKVYNNKDLKIPLSPSDTVVNYVEFLERCRRTWGGYARHAFIDSADQATITEALKYKRAHAECGYIFEGAYKKTTNIDRINLQNGWMNYSDEVEPVFFVCNDCKNYIGELNTYSWREDKDNEPEDGNDHCIQSWQYGWLPYKHKIGVGNGDNK